MEVVITLKLIAKKEVESRGRGQPRAREGGSPSADSKMLETAREKVVQARTGQRNRTQAEDLRQRDSEGQEPHAVRVWGEGVGLAVTLMGNLIVEVRGFAGNPYDEHTLAEQIEQSTILTQNLDVQPEVVYVDLGYRGVDKRTTRKSRSSTGARKSG